MSNQYNNIESITSLVINSCYIVFYSASFFITKLAEYQYDILMEYIDEIREGIKRDLGDGVYSDINNEFISEKDGGDISDRALSKI